MAVPTAWSARRRHRLYYVNTRSRAPARAWRHLNRKVDTMTGRAGIVIVGSKSAMMNGADMIVAYNWKSRPQPRCLQDLS